MVLVNDNNHANLYIDQTAKYHNISTRYHGTVKNLNNISNLLILFVVTHLVTARLPTEFLALWYLHKKPYTNWLWWTHVDSEVTFGHDAS